MSMAVHMMTDAAQMPPPCAPAVSVPAPQLDPTAAAGVARCLKTRPDALDEQAIKDSKNLGEGIKESAQGLCRSLADCRFHEVVLIGMGGARTGWFAGLPLRCRNALRRAVQTLKRKPAWMRRWGISELSMGQTVGNGDGVRTPLLRFIGTRRNDLVSTFPGAHVSLEEHMHALEALLQKAVTIHAAELQRLDLLDGFRASVNCIEVTEPIYKMRGKKVFYDRYHDEHVFITRFVEEISSVRGASKAGARAYSRKFFARMNGEYNGGNAVVREIIDELKGPHSNEIGNERVSPLPFFALPLHNRCAAEEEEDSRRNGEGDSYEEEECHREEVDDEAEHDDLGRDALMDGALTRRPEDE